MIQFLFNRETFSFTLHFYFLLPILFPSFLPFSSFSFSFFLISFNLLQLRQNHLIPGLLQQPLHLLPHLHPSFYFIVHTGYPSNTWTRTCCFSVPLPPVGSHHIQNILWPPLWPARLSVNCVLVNSLTWLPSTLSLTHSASASKAS